MRTLEAPLLHPGVRTFASPMEGTGVVAVARIPAGSVVTSQADGEVRVLTLRELRELPRDVHHLAYRSGDRYVLVSDGSQYVNHSCDPNTWWADDRTLVASRDIEPGEELTYDYATSEVHPWWRAKWRCRCGAPSCRGVVAGRDCLEPAFQRRHAGHLPSWTLEFIARNAGWRGAGYVGLAWLAEVARRAMAIVRPRGAPD